MCRSLGNLYFRRVNSNIASNEPVVTMAPCGTFIHSQGRARRKDFVSNTKRMIPLPYEPVFSKNLVFCGERHAGSETSPNPNLVAEAIQSGFKFPPTNLLMAG